MSGFDFQPSLNGSLVRLRALKAADFDRLQAVARNGATWADYPNRQMRETGCLQAWFSMGIETAKALAIFDVSTAQIIGTTRYYAVPSDPIGIGIGYTFLDASFRRQGQTNADLKRLMFDHAFERIERIWFHVLPDNLRSQAAVKKLGVQAYGVERLLLTD